MNIKDIKWNNKFKLKIAYYAILNLKQIVIKNERKKNLNWMTELQLNLN